MSDFKDEQIEELIRRICEGGGLERCRFEFYRDSDTKPRSLKENRNVENVPVLLENLRRKHGLRYEVNDIKKMSLKQLKQAYSSCVRWVQNPRKPYGISRRIYDIFAGGEAGDLFGKEKPAMIAYDSSGNVLFVLPHEVEGYSHFSLSAYVQKQSQSPREKAIVAIYDLLQRLKDYSCSKPAQ